MLDTKLRPLKDALLSPFVKLLSTRVHPDFVSVLAFSCGLGTAVALGFSNNILALVLWITNRILDGMDGLLARVAGKVSDAGGYLDIMLDFIVYASLPIALVLAPGGDTLMLAALTLLAVFYINSASWMYLAAIYEKRSLGLNEQNSKARASSVTMPPGLVEGAETIIFFSVLIILPELRLVTLWVFAMFTGLGALVRFALGYSKLRRS